jgi:hypothetical protein
MGIREAGVRSRKTGVSVGSLERELVTRSEESGAGSRVSEVESELKI